MTISSELRAGISSAVLRNPDSGRQDKSSDYGRAHMVGFVSIFGIFYSDRDIGLPINANKLNAKSDIALFFSGKRLDLIGLLQHARTPTHSVPVNALSGGAMGHYFRTAR